ncbi:MAG: hypothetical protein IJP27_09125, partial [Clostridia bacterium]|nr:hypothetical protein [Clostridia bacterium]
QRIKIHQLNWWSAQLNCAEEPFWGVSAQFNCAGERLQKVVSPIKLVKWNAGSQKQPIELVERTIELCGRAIAGGGFTN